MWYSHCISLFFSMSQWWHLHRISSSMLLPNGLVRSSMSDQHCSCTSSLHCCHCRYLCCRCRCSWCNDCISCSHIQTCKSQANGNCMERLHKNVNQLKTPKGDVTIKRFKKKKEMSGKWAYDLTTCCPVPCSVFCISGVLCQTCQQTKLHSYVLGESPPRVCSAIPCLFVFPMSFIIPCIPLYIQHCIIRRHVVVNLDIPEDQCTTCLISTCCTCSSTIQITETLYRELKVPAHVFMDEEDTNPLLNRDDDPNAY